MPKRIASKAKAKRALRKGHSSSYKSWTRSKNKGNVKKGEWAMPVDKDRQVVGDAKMKLVSKLSKAKSPKGVALAAKQYHSVINKTFKGRKKPYYTKYYTEFDKGRGYNPI
jgi:hypothetical protein